MTEAVTDRVIELAAEVFEVEPSELERTSTSDDIESWDSFAQLNLMVAIEDEYGIELDPERIGDLADLGALIDWVADLVAS